MTAATENFVCEQRGSVGTPSSPSPHRDRITQVSAGRRLVSPFRSSLAFRGDSERTSEDVEKDAYKTL